MVLVSTPSFRSLRITQSWVPSIRSRAGAPSLVASFLASLVKVPVVMNWPLSVLPTIAPRKSRISPGPTVPMYLLHWKNTWKLNKAILRTPIPSMPPSPRLPVTWTLIKPDDLRISWHKRSKASGGILWSIESSFYTHKSDSTGIAASTEVSSLLLSSLVSGESASCKLTGATGLGALLLLSAFFKVCLICFLSICCEFRPFSVSAHSPRWLLSIAW